MKLRKLLRAEMVSQKIDHCEVAVITSPWGTQLRLFTDDHPVLNLEVPPDTTVQLYLTYSDYLADYLHA